MSKVLIVEEDPMVAMINQRYLEMIGGMEVYGPVWEEVDVLEILGRVEIDLILLDVYLPKKNGFEILQTIRNKKYYMDVIMITAANSKEEVKRAYAYGVIDYIVKPFELSRFKTAIECHRKNVARLEDKEILDQKDIDGKVRGKEVAKELPKGLNRLTLDKIMGVLKDTLGKEWTLRELAKEVHSSNVTIKKYMDYLEGMEQVTATVTSGQVGRPEYRYQLK